MKILLVGTGGYASFYVQTLLNMQQPSVVWEGIVDPFYSACPYKEAIDARHIPVYDTMEQFYACHKADLAIICIPTHLHCEFSICALSNSSSVLCEKPVAPTVEETGRMLEAEKKYGRFIAIGYQWSYSDAIRELKADILKGTLGAPRTLKTTVSWPRSRAYYARGGGWGGRIQKDGRLILDSIASNACAHYLHNMLFVLGNTMQTSAEIETLQAECYRANAIENFDTCSMKLTSKDGIEIYFAATHAADRTRNPEFVYTFEKGVITYAQDEGTGIVAQFYDGSRKNYGDPFEEPFRKLWDCIDAIRNGTVPTCTVQTAKPHVQVIEALYRTTPIADFPAEAVGVNEETDTVFVSGLYEDLYAAYEKCCLLSELYAG